MEEDELKIRKRGPQSNSQNPILKGISNFSSAVEEADNTLLPWRRPLIEAEGNVADKFVTRLTGSEKAGDVAGAVTKFGADVFTFDTLDLPAMAGLVAPEPISSGVGAATLIGNRVRKGIKAFPELKRSIDEIFNLTRRGNDLVTADGVKVNADNFNQVFMSKTENPSGWDQIPKKNRDYYGDGLREIDKLAKVNKTKIRKYVEEFGGNEDDVTRIFNEHVLKQKNIKQSRTWLNQYFKKLTSGLGPDGLKNVKIMDVNGVATLVDGSTNKAIGHAFEVDHSKAKELMASLGLEGADFHENLDIVYTVWNRAKNNIGNPAIYDDVLRATGQSTSLRELVQRSLDKTFDAKFTRVPERFRDLARRQILEDIQAGVTIKGKPSKMRKQIIDKHLKFWDENSDLLVELDDYVPEELLNDPDFWADPQQTYESLLNMGVLDSLKPAYKKRVKRMTDQWVKLNRGSTAVRDYLEKTGGNTIKKKYN